MMDVLVLDRRPDATDAISRQLNSRGYEAVIALDHDAALDLIARDGANYAGFVTNLELGGRISGWDMARSMREVNPDAAIGYLSGEDRVDWAVNGVPGSVVIHSPGGEYEIPEDFFRLCRVALFEDGQSRAETLGSGRLAEAIARERDTLQLHLQRTPSFIAFLEGPEHCFVFANPAYIALVEREVVGSTVAEAFPEVVAQGFIEILDRVYRTGEEFAAHGIEFWMESADAKKKTTYLDLIYRPVRDTDGQIIGVFVEGEDLTAQIATQESIITLQNEIIHIARVNTMGLLASALAHELAQPVTAIHNYIGAASLVAQRDSPGSSVISCLEGATSAAIRANEIIHRLRSMTARKPVERRPTAIAPTLREAVDIACTGKSDVKVAFDLQFKGSVFADAIQLQQVVINLVMNAIEASPPGGANLLVSTAHEGSVVITKVSDCGSGIPADLLESLFDAFTTTKSFGMGVGLSLSRRIIINHGGTLSASNNEGGGATFTFTLPKAD